MEDTGLMFFIYFWVVYFLIGFVTGILWGRYMPCWDEQYDHGLGEFVKKLKTCNDRQRDFWGCLFLWWAAWVVLGFALAAMALQVICKWFEKYPGPRIQRFVKSLVKC